MEKKRELTCIVCPRGCALCVTLGEGGEVLSVTGNACKRGVTYATDECTNPCRMVTSTVLCTDGEVTPVRTERAVPKALVPQVMREINGALLDKSVTVGDVVIENIAGTGVNLIATACKEIFTK